MVDARTDGDLTHLPGALDRVDRSIARFMRRYGVRLLRWALAVIFVLFGILKPLGVSPAEDLVLATVQWVPVISPRTMYYLIGWWEVAIGVCLAIRPLVRLGILLLALQMVGTFMPLVIVPEACYALEPALGGRFMMWTFTTEAQYIIKNLLIIAGAMVVGGTVRQPNHMSRRSVRWDTVAMPMAEFRQLARPMRDWLEPVAAATREPVPAAEAFARS